nr:hypothetical protein [Sulfurimonas sp. SAG-AH-194-C20]
MSNFKLDIKRFDKQFGVEFSRYFADAIITLKPFVENGLIIMDESKIECSQTGTLLVKNIAMVFDTYKYQHSVSKKTFSKTV